MKCLACHFPISDIDLLVCVLCKNNYHYKCVNMTCEEHNENIIRLKREWRCPSCNNVTSRKRGADYTLIRSLDQQISANEVNNDNLSESQQADMSCDASILDLENDSAMIRNLQEAQRRNEEGESTSSISYGAFAALLNLKFTELRLELNIHFNKQIDTLRSEFNSSTNSLVAELRGLKQNLQSVTEKVNVLEEENKELQSKLAERKSVQSSDLQVLHDTITRLEIELNDKDQAALSNDLEISGIPEFKEESTVHTVMALATKIGVRLEEDDVVSADRVGPVREAAQSGGPESVRPRPLVVRLARRALRDQLLKSARVRRGATTEGLGLPDHAPSKFHLHDRLTKKNRALFNKARERGRSEQWRFIWSREGRIYVRKSESSKVHRIRTESDLDSIFPVASNSLIL